MKSWLISVIAIVLIGSTALGLGLAGDTPTSTAEREVFVRDHAVADLVAGDFPSSLPGRPESRPAEFEAVVERLRGLLSSRTEKLEVRSGGTLRVQGRSSTHEAIEKSVEAFRAERGSAPRIRCQVMTLALSAEQVAALGLSPERGVVAVTSEQWKAFFEAPAGSPRPASLLSMRDGQLVHTREDTSTKESPLEPLLFLELRPRRQNEEAARVQVEIEWTMITAHPHAKYKLAPTTSKPRWQSIDRRSGRLAIRAGTKPGAVSRLAYFGATHDDGTTTVCFTEWTMDATP